MPAAAAPDNAQRLLDIVRGLAHELRPQRADLAQLGWDASLERDYGLDSLARVELLLRIERELGARLNEKALAEAETPHDLFRLIASASSSSAAADREIAAFAATVAAQRPDNADTLLKLLDWRVAAQGDAVHITLYGEDEQPQNISYRMLQQQAQALAAGLLKHGLEAGNRVAIMLPTSFEFFAAFYGALYAGCVPVPLYPPARPSQIEDHIRRSGGIINNAEAAILVTLAQAKPLGQLLRAQCETLRAICTATELSAAGIPGQFRSPPLLAQDIAFLQYTSGSTGNPKGVVLTHANLLSNLRAMERASGITAADTFVSWLPLYHDMGLIGACIGSLFVGYRLVLMSPLAFLARPARWLWTIHRHRATVSAAPNFAYELCAGKLDERDLAGLDLSCWRLAYNGAEPVSPDTLEHFATHLAPYGFKRIALTPVYGLAECSLGLTFPPLERGPLIDCVERGALTNLGLARPAAAGEAHAYRFVSSGRPLDGHDVRIVDTGGYELPERSQGRVQFRGPSTTSGYFHNPEASARLHDGSWLNSGDLGYIAGGELYLTGREKDVIIRAGHNIYPQELEEAIGLLPGIRRGGVAVFPATDRRSGTEQLVVLAETHGHDTAEQNRLQQEIDRLAFDLIGMPVDDIVLAAPRTVLKTSSGKLRRAACRELYERGELGTGQRAAWRQWLRLGRAGAGALALRLLRRTSAWLWSTWAWGVFLVIASVVWLLIVLAPDLVLRRRIAKAGARTAIALCGIPLQVEGMQYLDCTTPLIVVANHASYLDAFVLTALLPARFAFVAKQELQHNRLAALPLRRLGIAFVERFDDQRSVEDALQVEQRARAGASLVIFAEGTFRRAPGLLPFKLGAFQIATRTGVPVVPVTLRGTRSMLRDEQWQPRHGKLKVVIGAPLTPAGDDWQAALQLRDAARRAILAQLDEPDAGA